MTGLVNMPDRASPATGRFGSAPDKCGGGLNYPLDYINTEPAVYMDITFN
jgi:hypothetical protein